MDGVTAAVGELAERGDLFDVLSACRVFAYTAVHALLALYGPPDSGLGEVWVLDDLGDAEGRPERLFAARLVTAHANGDQDTVTALVVAAFRAARRERSGSLRELVTYAAGLDARAAQKDRHERNDG
ncbi:hypothetical protein HUT18_11895 [Streptomyces sp. NA04227]|uniref:hypothetical protein n=1 Tax=Streptomyces sp. NA04227 TaxID=2742136 RepID=UPI001590BE68|nr:hypothetical protein [Streptomyces sp. NA04227]QKW07000.1 hypothetical protein HUT18_11895 [Streptomyces sp. NA04227]